MPPPPTVITTAPSKYKYLISAINARVVKKELKKARLRKQLSKIAEKMNEIKKPKLP